MGRIGLSNYRTYDRLLEIVKNAQYSPRDCAKTIKESGLSDAGIREFFEEVLYDAAYGTFAHDVYEEFVKNGGKPLPNLTKSRLASLRNLAEKSTAATDVPAEDGISNVFFSDVVFYGPLAVAAG